MLEPERERLIREDAVAEYVKAHRQEFIDGVIEQSTKHRVESVGVDSVIGGLQELHRYDYRHGEDSEGEVIAYAHPEACKNLYSDIDFMKDSDRLSIRGVKVETTPELPDNTILLIHSSAIAPSLPSMQAFKPWVIKDPNGVIFLGG